MELFQSVEMQATEVQQGWSSVLWFGATLALVWLLSVGRVPLAAPVDSLLASLAEILQAVF